MSTILLDYTVGNTRIELSTNASTFYVSTTKAGKLTQARSHKKYGEAMADFSQRRKLLEKQ